MFSRLKNRYYGTTSETTTETAAQTPEEAAKALRAAVSSEVTQETESFLTDSCLHRYLRARNGDVEKACRLLSGTLSWRQSYRPDLVVTRDLDSLKRESSTGKMYVLPEADKENRSTIIMRPGLENSRDSSGKIAYLVYTLERAAKTALSAGGERFVVIVDYTRGEISTSTLPSLSVSRETTNILQGHYPERLSCMVLVKAPKIFHSMFKLLRPLIDVKTREKIHFVQSCSEVANVEGIDPEAMPKDYGGTLDWNFETEEYFAKESGNKTDSDV